MTAAELDRKPPMAAVCITRRLSGATNVPGKLIRVVPQIRHLPPVALIQFPDGVEPVAPEHVVSIQSVHQDEGGIEPQQFPSSRQNDSGIVNRSESPGRQLSLL